jgi:hypothetical protein
MTLEQKREKNRLKNKLWREKNKESYLKSASKYRNKNRNKLKNYKLLKRYGISTEDYNLLLQNQNGKCSICGNDEIAIHKISKQKQKLAVDHCHETGKVRGLLCQDCNRGIGLFHENILRLEKAINYLLKFQQSNTIKENLETG